MNPIRWKLHWQILLALALSALFGLLVLPQVDADLSQSVVGFCDFLGKLFL